LSKERAYDTRQCENGCPALTFDFRGIGESLNGAASPKKYSCPYLKLFHFVDCSLEASKTLYAKRDYSAIIGDLLSEKSQIDVLLLLLRRLDA
jgi:hypothetical protein